MDHEGEITFGEDGILVLVPKNPSPRARHSPSMGLRRQEQKPAALDTAPAGNAVEDDKSDNNMLAAPGEAMDQAEIDQHDKMDLGVSDADNNDHPMRDIDDEANSPPIKSVSKVTQKGPSPASAALKSLTARNSNFDREFWLKRVKYPSKGVFCIGTVIEHLGLQRSQTGTNFSFKNKTVSKLAQTLRVITHKIADGDDAQVVDAHVVDVAVDPAALAEEVDELMEEFGEKIWGAEGEKEWLATPGEYGEYAHELHFHDDEENKVIREYLRLWIVLKAINTRIYIKYRKPAVKPEVEDSDSTDESEADDDLDRELDAYDSDSPKEARPIKARLPDRNPFVRIEKLDGSRLIMAFRLDKAKVRKARAVSIAQAYRKSINFVSRRPVTPSEAVQENPKTPETTQSRLEEQESAVKTAESKLARLRAAKDALGSETTKGLDASPTVKKLPVATKTEKAPDSQFVSTVAQRLADSRRTRAIAPVYNEKILAGIKKRAPRKDKGIPHKLVSDAPVDSAAIQQTQHDTPEPPSRDAPRHGTLSIPRWQAHAHKKRALSPSSHPLAMQRPQEKKQKPNAPPTQQNPAAKLTAPSVIYTEDPDPIRRHILHSRPFTTAFTRFLDPRVRAKYSAKSLLANVQLAATHLILAIVPIALPAVLAAWLAFQRTVVSVRKRAPAALDPAREKVQAAAECSRLWAELRMARDGFVHSHEDAQGVLRRAVENMLGGDERADHVADGMKKLDGEVEALGDRLWAGEWI